MKHILLPFRLTAVIIHNTIVFLSIVIPQRIPLRLWRKAWNKMAQSHEREIVKNLTTLTMNGEIKRRIVDGHFVYYPVDDE